MWALPIARSARSVRQFKYSHGGKNFERPRVRSALEVERTGREAFLPTRGSRSSQGRSPAPGARGSGPGGGRAMTESSDAPERKGVRPAHDKGPSLLELALAVYHGEISEGQ